MADALSGHLLAILKAAGRVTCEKCGVPLTALPLSHHTCRCKALVSALHRAGVAARSAPKRKRTRPEGHPKEGK